MIVITLAFVAVCGISAYALYKWHDADIESNSWNEWYKRAIIHCDAIADEYTSQLKREIDKHNTFCNELIELLDDADADIAFLKANTTDIFMELQASQMQFFGALQEIDELKAELEKVNHNIRKRCPHCNTYMTKDGVCNNEKCKSKKILNATEAAKIIETGGFVSSIGSNSKAYYGLSARNDGSIGCYRISDMPHNGWCFRNTQEFIDGMKDIKLIQVYPECLKNRETHVEANKSEKPILNTTELITEPKPILADAESVKKGDKQ